MRYFQSYEIKSKKELADFIENRQLEGYKLLHTAKSSGYISRLVTAYITEYSGRFGVGYVIHRPRRDTSGYHDVQYLVKSKYDQNSNDRKERGV